MMCLPQGTQLSVQVDLLGFFGICVVWREVVLRPATRSNPSSDPGTPCPLGLQAQVGLHFPVWFRDSELPGALGQVSRALVTEPDTGLESCPPPS